MSRGVICGVDDSAAAVRALEVARELAEQLELPLHVVHVVGRDTGAEEMAAATALARTAAAGAAWTVERGHPADRLVAVAEETRASYVVVGCHGPRSSLLGSISADVSRRAPCPVVVVPDTIADPPLRERVAGGIVRFGLGSENAGTRG